MNGLGRLITLYAITGLLMVSVFGCPRTSVEDGERPPESGAIFRHRWWNYYTRGLENTDRQAYDDAEKDFKAAIAQRDGDQRMARTYGMHFIDYFPRREMGVLYWHAGDLAAAEKALERSIKDYPSAKARYYLDQVRKARIRRKGAEVPPPHLKLSLPDGVYWTRRDPVLIKGRVLDPHYIASITVAGTPLFLEASQKETAFQHEMALPQGRHMIAVTAANLAGVAETLTVTVHVDRQGPWVVIDDIKPDSAGVRLRGKLFDDAGTVDLTINNEKVPIIAGPQTAFTHFVGTTAPAVVFKARDRVGNTTRIAVQPSALRATGRSRLVASAMPLGIELAGLFQDRDRKAPVIRLADWKDVQTVYLPQVVLCGTVRDPGKVVRLTVNGEEVLPQNGAMVLFSHFIPLEEGPNPITLVAEDTAGNQTVKQIRIIRKIPKVRLLSERLRLSVFAFERKGEISGTSLAFQDNFIHQLVRQNRFQLVEREQLDHILEEQKISRSRLIDPSTAVRMGRLATAQAVVAGSMVETRTGIEIIGRVIDTETSEILSVSDAYTEDKQLTGLQHLAKTLALKIHREFPLVDGRVVEKNKNMIFTDLGSEKIRAQRHLLVFEEQPVHHAETGQMIGNDCQILGRARIVHSEPQFSKADLQPGCSPAIKPRHKVMTQ